MVAVAWNKQINKGSAKKYVTETKSMKANSIEVISLHLLSIVSYKRYFQQIFVK